MRSASPSAVKADSHTWCGFWPLSRSMWTVAGRPWAKPSMKATQSGACRSSTSSVRPPGQASATATKAFRRPSTLTVARASASSRHASAEPNALMPSATILR